MKANWAGVACVVLLMAGTAQAAATEAQKCQASKNKAAGTYAACRQNAERILALTADAGKYGAAITKCEGKFTAAWQKAIEKATAAGAVCPDAPLTVAAFQPVIDEHTDNIATALAGGGLQDCPADLETCNADLAACQGVTCGNGVLDQGEDCDLGHAGSQTCVSRGLVGGMLCGAGCAYDNAGCFGRAFVTSTVLPGNFGGLAVADAECQARAGTAGLGGKWVAWLSDAATNAKDRLPDTEYRLVDGRTIVANNKADLLDGSLDNKINQDENGTSFSGLVWVGTKPDGTRYANRCNDWTTTDPIVNGMVGSADYTTFDWTSYGDHSCSGSYGFFCFEQ